MRPERHANTTDFRAGDEVFKAPKYEEISLANWLSHVPPALVAAPDRRCSTGVGTHAPPGALGSGA